MARTHCEWCGFDRIEYKLEEIFANCSKQFSRKHRYCKTKTERNGEKKHEQSAKKRKNRQLSAIKYIMYMQIKDEIEEKSQQSFRYS